MNRAVNAPKQLAEMQRRFQGKLWEGGAPKPADAMSDEDVVDFHRQLLEFGKKNRNPPS